MHPPPTPDDYAISKIHTVVKRTCADFKVNKVERGAIVKLNALMRAKMTDLAHSVRHLMENAGRTQPRIDDVLAAFKINHVDMWELIMFGKSCTGIEAAWARFQFPVADQKIDHFEAMYGPKPSAHELKHRPENIPVFHRALHPEWIGKETEGMKKMKTMTEKEFEKLRAPTYPWQESPLKQMRRLEKERRQADDNARAKARNEERFREGITRFRNTELPNYEDMEFGEFFEDWEACKEIEEKVEMEKENKEKELEQKKMEKKEEHLKKGGDPTAQRVHQMKRPNILKKATPRVTILLDEPLPLTAIETKKTHSITTVRSSSTPSPKFTEPMPTLPSTSAQSEDAPFPPIPSPKLLTKPAPTEMRTPNKFTPPLRLQSSRQKKPRGETFDPSPVSPSTSAKPKKVTTPACPTPSPKLLTKPTPTKMRTPDKFTPPLRPQSSRQKKPRGETFDPSPVPRKSSGKRKRVDQQNDAVAEQKRILDQIQDEPKEEQTQAPIKLKFKFPPNFFSAPQSGPLLPSDTPRSPLKVKLNLTGVRMKEADVVEEVGGKENGDKKKERKESTTAEEDVVEEDPSAVCPKCNVTYPNEMTIGCDQCGGWFHWQCVGVLEEPTDDEWFCPECVKKRKVAGKRPSTSARDGSTPAKRGRKSKK